MELTTSRGRVAVHEGAHLAAGLLLGRPVRGAWLNADGSGGSYVGTIRADREIDLEGALDDLTIHFVGDLAAGACPPYSLADDAGTDEAQARDVAFRVCDTAEEAKAVRFLGRARAKAMTERPDFIALTEAFAAELMHHDLDTQAIERIREEVTNGNTKQAA